ncbi:MAG: transcription antitermination factor NusB [Phycisphaerales bacterium]
MPYPAHSNEIDQNQNQSQNRYPPPADARDAAYRVLSAHAKSFPDLLPVEPEVEHLDPRDRALAHAIIRESVVRWMTLRHIVTQLAGRGFETIEPRMQGVLIGAAAQLLLLDRLPPHAVINESVEWAKKYIRPKAGGMTNAVLRKVARSRGAHTETLPEDDEHSWIPLSAGGALILEDIHLPQDDISKISTQYSIPKGTIKRWQHLHPEQAAELIAHTLVYPPTIIYNADWSAIHDPDDLELLSPHQSDQHRVYTGSRSNLPKLLDSYLDMRVQDSASSAVVNSIPDCKPAVIVDYCAGQGTKTCQLAERFPHAHIIAMEIDHHRLNTLSKVCKDLPNAQAHHIDDFEEVTPEGADLILTDVPCSNSGVLARRMEARYRPMTVQLHRLVQIQQDIIETVLTRLKPGGMLTYSTCSIEAEENQDQRSWMLDSYDLNLIAEHVTLPATTPGDDPSMYTDGSYACVLQNPSE